MDIGKIIMDNLVSFGIAAIIITPFCAYLYVMAKKYGQSLHAKLDAQIDLINDPEIRKLVEGIIEETELAFGSENGRAKFAVAKAEILKVVPDMFDPYVEKLLQGVYDGMVQKLEQ